MSSKNLKSRLNLYSTDLDDDKNMDSFNDTKQRILDSKMEN